MKKRKRHTPEQIVKNLRVADVMLAAGKSVDELPQAWFNNSPRVLRPGGSWDISWSTPFLVTKRVLCARRGCAVARVFCGTICTLFSDAKPSSTPLKFASTGGEKATRIRTGNCQNSLSEMHEAITE